VEHSTKEFYVQELRVMLLVNWIPAWSSFVAKMTDERGCFPLNCRRFPPNLVVSNAMPLIALLSLVTICNSPIGTGSSERAPISVCLPWQNRALYLEAHDTAGALELYDVSRAGIHSSRSSPPSARARSWHG
jgi:hypothetical protein